jgi:hypothetical protein
MFDGLIPQHIDPGNPKVFGKGGSKVERFGIAITELSVPS